MQWIRESKTDTDEHHESEQFKTSDDFVRLLTWLDIQAPNLLDLLAARLTAPPDVPSIESLKEFVQTLEVPSFESEMLLTAACAYALKKSPRVETWQRIMEVSYNSWEIEYWLNASMLAIAHRYVDAKNAYIELARLLFQNLESGSLRSRSERRNEARERSWLNWQSVQYPLEELFYGLRHSDFMAFEDEFSIFRLISDIAPSEIQQAVVGLENPLIINAILMSAGVGPFRPRLAQWEVFVKTAPLAFFEDGSWTGSPPLPLLMSHARNELLEPGRNVPRNGADEATISLLTQQVSQLVEVVVQTLASRKDAPAALMRWSTWIMQQMLHPKEGKFDDIRSSVFVDEALLKAIGNALKGQLLIAAPPEGAGPWEHWCFRCVQSLFAFEGIADTPSFEDFSKEWDITPENWYSHQGRSLLEKASLHLPRDESPDISANLLAFPLVSLNDFSKNWKRLWDRAYQLREIVEFGSPDAGKKNYSDRADASHLLLLLGFMGLACFDQGTTRLVENNENLKAELIDLHEALAGAVREVLYIDDTLNHSKWKTLLYHLALRRFFWEETYASDRRTPVFTKHDFPTVKYYLQQVQPDPGELVNLLHACMLNDLDKSKLREELQEASVNLKARIDTLRHLHSLRDNRYPMKREALRAIEPLLD